MNHSHIFEAYYVDLDVVTDKQINRLIDDVITDWSNDRFDHGMDGVRELAKMWANATEDPEERKTMSKSFVGLCRYMTQTAVDNTRDEQTRLQIRAALHRAKTGRVMVVQ